MSRCTFAAIVAALAWMGCGGEDGGSDAVDAFPLDVPAAGPDTLVIEFPEQIIPGATEKQNCLYLEPLEEEMYVTVFEGYQGAGGHHLFLFRALEEQPPGTIIDCTDVENMKDVLPAVFSSNFSSAEIPEGMAVRLPAGTQLMVQQHYVNTQPRPIRVRDVAHITAVDPATVSTELGFYAWTDIDFNLPARSEHTVTFDCAAPAGETSLLLMGPHMHEWGRRITVEITRPGGAPEMIYEVDGWQPDWRDLPPVADHSDAPLVVSEGDTITVSCHYANDLDSPIEFPQEMCAVYGYFYPVTGSPAWICTAGGGGEGGAGCAQPGDEGNELGVGKYCTADGNECSGLTASFCPVSFDSRANYCTVILCETDDECGTGASCVHGDSGSACVPDHC